MKKILLTVLLTLVAMMGQAIDEYHFHGGTAVIKGRLVNKPIGDGTTLSVHTVNLFTDQEHIQSIPVAADGTFNGTISLPHSQAVMLKDVGHVFLAVGDTVELTKDATQGEEDGVTFSGHTTSALINQLWPALKKRYFGDEQLSNQSVSLEEIPAWKQRMVKLMDAIIADIKADRLPLPAGVNAYAKEVLGACLLAEPFEATLRTFRSHMMQLLGKRADYYDFVAEREQWLLNNPAMMLVIDKPDYLIGDVGNYLLIDIAFLKGRLYMGSHDNELAAMVDYKSEFFLPRHYDAALHRSMLALRADTLLTKADYYRKAAEAAHQTFHLGNNFMQQVVLTRQIFTRVDDEDNTTPDQKAAVFAAVIPLITNPIVSHQAVEAYRQYVISSEGKPQQTASKTPEADALFERLIAPYKGNALYLDFWAMYCGPCKTDMLNQREKVERLKDKPVRFLYICDERDSSREKAEKWMQDNNIKGEHIFVSHEEWKLLNDKFQFYAVPFVTAMDKEGNIITRKVLDKLLGE